MVFVCASKEWWWCFVVVTQFPNNSNPMNLSCPDSFPLPPACKRAVPFFEESDSLREHATCVDDLTAAFYLRWAGLKVCIELIPTLNPNESGYVNVIVDRLLQQIQEMKTAYQTNEADGLVASDPFSET